MKCWYCNGDVIWQSDFDASDYGYEEDGIVTVLVCSECNAEYTIVKLEGGECDG